MQKPGGTQIRACATPWGCATILPYDRRIIIYFYSLIYIIILVVYMGYITAPAALGLYYGMVCCSLFLLYSCTITVRCTVQYKDYNSYLRQHISPARRCLVLSDEPACKRTCFCYSCMPAPSMRPVWRHRLPLISGQTSTRAPCSSAINSLLDASRASWFRRIRS